MSKLKYYKSGSSQITEIILQDYEPQNDNFIRIVRPQDLSSKYASIVSSRTSASSDINILKDGSYWSVIKQYYTVTNQSRLAGTASTGSYLSSAYGNGTFLCVQYLSSPGGSSAATSADGVTWTQRTLSTQGEWSSAAYGAGVFVICGRQTSGGLYTICMSSSDGITWSNRTLPASISAPKVVTYGIGIFVMIAVGSSSYFTSGDGTTWTQRSLPISSTYNDIVYGNGLFFISDMNDPKKCLVSSDGINWSQKTNPGYSSVNNRFLSYGDGYFFDIQRNGTSQTIYKTLNGDDWSQVSNPSVGSGLYFGKILYGNGILIMPLGESGGSVSNIIYYSTNDGDSWSNFSLSFSSIWSSYSTAYGSVTPLVYGNGKFVLMPVGLGSQLATIP